MDKNLKSYLWHMIILIGAVTFMVISIQHNRIDYYEGCIIENSHVYINGAWSHTLMPIIGFCSALIGYEFCCMKKEMEK